MAKGYWIARVDVHNDEGGSPALGLTTVVFSSCIPSLDDHSQFEKLSPDTQSRW